METNLFTLMSIIIAIGAAISVIMRLLKQPLIIGYILTGIVVGPFVLNLVHADETFEVFSKIGIALLLFIIGLGLNPRVVREVGKVALLTGIGQIFFTSVAGFAILTAFGFEIVPAIVMALALSFSSTIIVLKLLSDKKEQNRLYGKITIGFLLVQDLVATLALVVVSTMAEGSGISTTELGTLLLNGLWLSAIIILVAMKVLPKLSTFIASNQEFLFLFSIGWGFGIASLFALIGFSLEIGALIAGVGLASLPYAHEVSARLRPLRDFFVILFFITLGSRLALENLQGVVWQAVALSGLVLIGNPIVVMTILGLLGYTKKTSFKAGLAVAQISEFSLVLLLLAQSGGLISDQAVALVTLVGLITIAVSSYMIVYSDNIFNMVEHQLRLFERRKPRGEREHLQHYDFVLLGYRKGGQEFYKAFKDMHHRYVVVDYDPEVIDQLEQQKVHFIYGDATDVELLDEINIEDAKLVVTTITDHATNLFLAQHLNEVNPSSIFICHSDHAKEATELYDKGADYVMMPHYIGSERMSTFLKKNGLKRSEFKKAREKHLLYIQSHMD